MGVYDGMPREQLVKYAHTPHSHSQHKSPCGCAVDDLGGNSRVICRGCAATYVRDQVMSFAAFHCYDCDRYIYLSREILVRRGVKL